MHAKLEEAQDRFISSIGALAASFGINQFIAQLYAVLYLSDEPMSLDELVEKLKASKGNVSLNIRELEKWGAVKSVWVKGSRKDYYQADPDVKKVAINKIKSGVQSRIAKLSEIIVELKKMISDCEGQMAEDDKKTAKSYRDKLKKIEDMVELASKALILAEKLF